MGRDYPGVFQVHQLYAQRRVCDCLRRGQAVGPARTPTEGQGSYLWHQRPTGCFRPAHGDGWISIFFLVPYPRGGKLGDFQLNVPGRHNILNALACISLGLQLGIPYEVMFKTLKNFTGVKRRFQLKGRVDDVTVIDDYGHHPTEIAATLNTARSFAPKRLVTVFQPHRYSRTKFLLDEFAEHLSLSDELILTDIYAAGEKPSEGVGVEVLLEKLQKKLGPRVVFLKKADILKYLQALVSPGDMVLFLGAGDIYHLSDEFVKILSETQKVS